MKLFSYEASYSVKYQRGVRHVFGVINAQDKKRAEDLVGEYYCSDNLYDVSICEIPFDESREDIVEVGNSFEE